nr:hypothetical protein [uncultured Trichococcus sp.]
MNWPSPFCGAALIFGVGFVNVEKMDTLLLSIFFVRSGFGKMDKDSIFMFMVRAGVKKMNKNFISIFLVCRDAKTMDNR